MRISDWSSDVCSSDLTHSLISDFWLFREAEPEDIHCRADNLERQCRHLPQTRGPAIRSDHKSCADILSVLQSDTTDAPSLSVSNIAGLGIPPYRKARLAARLHLTEF